MNARPVLATALLALAALASAGSTLALDTRVEVNTTIAKPVVRGGIVYRNYCQLCHGDRGDGLARAAKLYDKAKLAIRPQPEDFYVKVIREGGKAVGQSEFMPAYKDELSNEQIADVVAYLKVVANQITRGSVVFNTFCVLCHGLKGDGKGRASVLYNPPPADLTRSDKNEDYKRRIVTLGGKAMGRSEVMPMWEDQLTPAQIDDVVAYIQTLVKK